MKKLLFGVVAFLIFETALADDIYLKTGYIMKNVQALDTVQISAEKYLNIFTRVRNRRVPLERVQTIIRAPLDPNVESPLFVKSDSLFRPEATEKIKQELVPFNQPQPTKPSYSISYPNMKLLPITFVAAGLSWDFFAQAGDIQTSIDQLNQLAALSKTTINTSELESTKTRKTILGVVFLIAGTVNTFLCFTDAEIIPAPNSITLSYHF